jgi:shikimate dehydrogenase
MSDLYAVMGNPIEHSLSPQIHHEFALQTHQDIIYEKRLIPTDEFEGAVEDFFAQGGKGLNITLPFKERAFKLAKNTTKRAYLAQSANTLWLGNGALFADNTDGIGLAIDLERLVSISSKSVLIIGASGAARGVVHPLLECNPSKLHIANRTAEKAYELANSFRGVTASGLNDIQGTFDIIINATSASLNEKVPEVSPEILKKTSLCYDMVYASKPTAFMRWAGKHGVTNVADGLGMLVGQAAEAFFIWRGIKPNVGKVYEKLRLT